MNYADLLRPSDVEGLQGWLVEADGELLVQVDFPHSGGSGDCYLIRSVADLVALLRSIEWPELSLSVLAGKPFPHRGVVDDAFIERILGLFPEKQWWHIVEPAHYYPLQYGHLASGDTKAELTAELTSLRGRSVWIGEHPLDRLRDLGADEEFHIGVSRSRNVWSDVEWIETRRYRK